VLPFAFQRAIKGKKTEKRVCLKSNTKVDTKQTQAPPSSLSLCGLEKEKKEKKTNNTLPRDGVLCVLLFLFSFPTLEIKKLK
jgi:hypothetical protein